MKRLLLVSTLLLAFAAQAKLPVPVMDDAAKAKAAEAKAKADHGNKVDSYKLCEVQDRLAVKYGKALQPMAASACVNPGPFVYAVADQKPAEAAGAHSPPATAVSPPSTLTPAAAKGP